ncbi:MAG: ATP-binding protein [Planctomycetota bacterium]
MIFRKIETELLASIAQFPVTVLLGARQVGKTTLAKSVRDRVAQHSAYLDLEIPSDLQKVAADGFLYLKQQENKTVIIDEVQRLPELFPIIRALVDQNRTPGRFILLGSASKTILTSASESLAGRVNYLEMQPIELCELVPNKLMLHLLKGGFPEAYLSKDNKRAKQWFDGFTSSYIERDLPMLGLNASPIMIRRLLLMLASVSGGLVNYTTLASSLGISQPTVKHYVDFLEQAYVVRRLAPYHNNLGKRLTKSHKLYFRDSGLLHYFLNIFDEDGMLGNPHLGNVWESYVLQQIIPQLNYQTVPYFYRTHNGAELDLLLVQASGVKVAIEVKFSSAPTLSKGNRAALADAGGPDLLTVIPSGETYQSASNEWIVAAGDLHKTLKKYQVLKSH